MANKTIFNPEAPLAPSTLPYEGGAKVNVAAAAPTVNDDTTEGYEEGSIWVDTSDSSSPGYADKIEEGNSSVEVIDTGTGQVDSKIDGSLATRLTSGGLQIVTAVIIDKATGKGIKVDTASSTFGWRDLLGQIRTRGVGGNDPTDSTYRGNIKGYKFAVNDECWANYHIPHDYVAGTDIFLHFHWSHVGVFVTGGTVTWGADITYAKGHNQAAFPASVNTTIAGNASTTQYQHIITEVQISASAPSASQIDTDDLEPDGVIMIRGYLSANAITVSEGAVPDPFLHFKDIHYQSTNIATKNKVPDFYS